jgi:hypothetical protein
MTPAVHYVDAAEFTRMFRQRRKNYAQICATLHKIAGGVAARFWFASAQDRDDAKSFAILHAIERIDRFNMRRGDDAFSYYSIVIRHAIGRHIDRNRSRSMRTQNFSDVAMPQDFWSPDRGIRTTIAAASRIGKSDEIELHREAILDAGVPYALAS